MARIVVVLGGNAFVAPGQRLTMEGQFRFAHEAMKHLLPLVAGDNELLISHGNGPQVGQMLTRVEAAIGKAYPLPLEVCVAESEGELGYVLQQAFYNVLAEQGRARASVVMLSQVEVDPADPAFTHPTKPVGVFYDEEQAQRLREHGFALIEDAGRGWRRVVPSPEPLHVLELEVIGRLLAERIIVIAAGGGGIPVVRRGGQWEGVEAVVDKDLTGALLATRLDADRLVILTDVPCVYRDYRQATQAPLECLGVDVARQLMAEGHFAAGSMLPKVEAAVRFAEQTGKPAIICNPSNLADALEGRAGTRVVAAGVPTFQGTARAVAAPSTLRAAVAPMESSAAVGEGRSSGGPLRAARQRCLIMGAAGRDFHNFRAFFRDRPEFEVLAFTAAQIPFIAQRTFPASLAGPGYPHGIPIHDESLLGPLIDELAIEWVFLAYSDLSHEEVMHKASLAQSHGASFALLGPRHTQIVSRRPVIAVTASRTGVGKSPVSQYLAGELSRTGWTVGVLRHPMPYGDLEQQRVERLATRDDLDRHNCTVEEREEYEPYIDRGLTIHAGVDYVEVLAAAESEANVILWDGGNNDFPFVRPSISIVLVDALRRGHESRYYPGETNVRAADVLILNKADGAAAEELEQIEQSLRLLNPRAVILRARLALTVDRPDLIAGRRAVVVEDGPTLTHGGMSFGAGTVAAREYGASEQIDPRAHAVGTIAAAYREFPHLGAVLPALGYSESQRRELAETIARCGAEVVIDASPCRLERLITIDQPLARVSYQFEQMTGPPLLDLVRQRLGPCPH